MIDKVYNVLTNPQFVSYAQNTNKAIITETGLKAAGRPLFILGDKHADKQTQKYAASKEFLYQILCLGVYLAIIPFVFKKGSYKLAKELFKEEAAIMPQFKNMSEFLKYNHYANQSLLERTESKTLGKFIGSLKPEIAQKVRPVLVESKNPEQYKHIKGCVEAGSILGSIIGLTILAPEISHLVLHPIMDFFHIQSPKAKNIDKTA